MISVLLIFGTRPEAIKMAPLVKELKKNPKISCKVCITAQHRQMLDQILKTFDIVPDYDLDIMEEKQTLTGITVKVLTGLEKIIQESSPNIVLVHGDTTTTMAGTIAAFYNKVAVGHVEAGLRTWNKYSPYPEEMNRQIVDCMTDMYFAPTELSAQNLLNENREKERIFITGNTAIDALKTTITKDYCHPELDLCKGNRIILLTSHRRENIGEPMRNIFRAVNRITKEFTDVKVIYPVHFNPLVRQIANEVLKGNKNVKLIDPLDVLDFHNFINSSYIILTDSGGIQEEAPSLGKPVLVLRDTTERPEGVDAGTLLLAGTEEEDIYNLTKELLTNSSLYEKMSRASNPYGDGYASKRIADAIVSYFEK